MPSNDLAIVVNAALETIKAHGNTGLVAVSGYYFKDIINELAKDLVKPSAAAIGNLFGKIIEHGTFQSQYSRDSALKIGKAFLQIANKYSETKPEDLVDNIPPEISVPLFNKLTYFEDNDLRDLLISLLAGSMLKKGQIHPAIISLADRLSSGEAKILKRLSSNKDFGPWPSITIKAALKPRSDSKILISKNEISKLTDAEKDLLYDNYNIDNDNRTAFRDIGAQHLALLNSLNIFENFEDAYFCVSNLRLLGLIEITPGYITVKIRYINLISEAYEFIESARKETKNEPIFEIEKLSITPLGKKVINAFNF